MHHHMIRDRTGETTSFHVLDRVFGNVPQQEEKGARAAARLWTQLSHLRRSVFRLRDERECAALLLAGHPASSRVSV
jgi:hypothetical protein